MGTKVTTVALFVHSVFELWQAEGGYSGETEGLYRHEEMIRGIQDYQRRWSRSIGMHEGLALWRVGEWGRGHGIAAAEIDDGQGEKAGRAGR